MRAQAAHLSLITQNDHARLAGELAAHWGNDRIPASPPPREALILATALHDAGWIPLDEQPLWNPATGQPFSFIDEPLVRKLPHYSAGLDLVEQQDAYAALLCSRHYASFFPPDRQQELGDTAVNFAAAEHDRQERLRNALRQAGRQIELDREAIDLGLLKLWDDLSLYVGLNEPGVAKAREHPWYRSGFRTIPLWPTGSGCATHHAQQPPSIQLHARWLDLSRIALRPFPLQHALVCRLSYRRLTRSGLDAENFEQRLRQAPWEEQHVRFVPDPDGIP